MRWLCLALAAYASSAFADLPTSVPRDGTPNVMAELRAGNSENIVYFGGSITAGAGASDVERTSYRALVGQWFRKSFPNSAITDVNAAIGGTGSELGVFRVGRDVLSKKPDLVFIEFAVNDGGASDAIIDRSIEGIVRQILRADDSTDIVFVYTFTVSQLDSFRESKPMRTVTLHEKVAAHYGIPSVNVAVPAAARIIDDSLASEAFAKDGVHPSDAGYRIYADTLIAFLESQKDLHAPPKRHVLPDPLASDQLENAQMKGVDQLGPPGQGWTIEKSPVSIFPAILASGSPGSVQEIEFRGSMVGLYFALGPDSGALDYRVDDGPWKIFSPFDKYAKSGFRPSSRTLEEGLHNGKHTLTLKVRGEIPMESKGTVSRIGFLLVAPDAKQE